MSGGILAAARQYLELGFDPIPLDPGTKEIHARGWQRRSIGRLWQDAPADANIGLRGGGGGGAPAFLDCDDKNIPGTFDRAVSWLAGLGIMHDEYPVIQSASGVGRQIYVSFAGALPGDYRNLSPEFGAGEFRYGPGAYVCAPPSRVGGAVYQLLAGDLRQLPRLVVDDLRDILRLPAGAPKSRKALTIPRRTRALLNGNADALAQYATRHQAEQAIITGLINAGFDFTGIETLFLQYPAAGNYQERRAKNPRDAARWLQRSYDAALEWTANNESQPRRIVATLEAWAASTPWPGRSGLSDRAVFLAHVAIAYRAGKTRWAASTRTLAELAATTPPTAGKATARLCTRGLLSLALAPTAENAGVYQLGDEATQLYTTLPPAVGKCKVLSSHDAFRWAGLGKSRCEVYQALTTVDFATVTELAERTGRHPRTVTRALEEFSHLVDTMTGEFIPMVEAVGDGWRVVDGVDLEHVARVVGTAGAGERQREKHAEERRAHKLALACRNLRDGSQ